MRVHVRTGNAGSVEAVEVEPAETVGDLLGKVLPPLARPPPHHGATLSLAGVLLCDRGATLHECGVRHESTVVLAWPPRGGGMDEGTKAMLNTTLSKLPCKDVAPLLGSARHVLYELYGYLHNLVKMALGGQPMAQKDLATHLVKGEPFVDMERINEMAEVAMERIACLRLRCPTAKVSLVLEGKHPYKLASDVRTTSSAEYFAKGKYGNCLRPSDCLVRRILVRLRQEYGDECIEGTGVGVVVLWPWSDADAELGRGRVG